MHIMDELQENAIYFIVGFMLALMLSFVIDPLLVMIIGVVMIIFKEVLTRYEIHKEKNR